MTVDVSQEIQISKLQWGNNNIFNEFSTSLFDSRVLFSYTHQQIDVKTNFIYKLIVESRLLRVNRLAASVGKHRSE